MKQRVLLSKKEMTEPVIEYLTPVTTVLRADDTIRDALSSLQGRKVDEKIFYFYVLTCEGMLVGVVSTRNLLLAPLDAKVLDVMDPAVVTLLASQTMKDALEELERLRLLALPVIDEEHRLLGMVDVQNYVEQPLKSLNSEIRKNIFQFIGITIEEGRLGTPWKGFTARMPWIFCNMVAGLACAVISKAYQNVLAHALILAMFIPLVLTLCESISMQAMTQSLTILRSPRLLWNMVRRRLSLEAKTVLLLSFTSAVVVALLSYLWGGGWGPVFVLGISIFTSIIIAAIVGTMVPIGLKVFKMDPKIASGPVVLMIVDVLATTFYLTTAQWLLLS